MSSTRSRIRALERRRPSGQGEIWLRDLPPLGDGLCRPSGEREPALTLAQLHALRGDGIDRVLVETYAPDDPDGPPEGADGWELVTR